MRSTITSLTRSSRTFRFGTHWYSAPWLTSIATTSNAAPAAQLAHRQGQYAVSA
jgi:hypothetical protein